MATWLKITSGVAFSVAATLLMLLAVSSMPGMEIPQPYWAVGAVCPALVSAPVCIVLVRLSERHRAMSIELKRANERLERISERDSLTDLLNRGVFFDRAEALHRSSPGWLLMVDIDHFKKINDSYGHDVGDQALRSVARAICAVAEAPAICGRLGGEEFVVYCPGGNMAAAMAMADDIRAVVQASVLAGKVHLTVSVGVAGGPDVSTISAGLKAADQAMYVAKRNGRNQVRAAA